jgi:hypothetical protein
MERGRHRFGDYRRLGPPLLVAVLPVPVYWSF